MTETDNPKELKHPDQQPEQKKRSGFARFFGRDKDSDQQPSAEPVTVEAGLDKSRSSLMGKIGDVFKGSFDINDELFDDLEEVLITCDIGVQASLELVDKLRQRVQSDKIQDAAGVVAGLKAEIAIMLEPAEQPWNVFHQRPYVMLMVGVNGVGKTTTTAKIAKQFRDQGKTVMLAAADTFRAAAVEQLQEWGRRMDIPVVAQAHGADAAAVAHDALSSAIVKGIEVLIIDTAGRLHTQSDLMEQLQKINRVLANLDPSMPHEIMQILDAGTGQNALSQLEHFQKAVGVTSICLTKLDGSAKGGLAISLTQKYKLPIRYIGVGEGYMDLKPFNAKAFADALVPDIEQLKSDPA
jgi:fused signal recognition particle receptor